MNRQIHIYCCRRRDNGAGPRCLEALDFGEVPDRIVTLMSVGVDPKAPAGPEA